MGLRFASLLIMFFCVPVCVLHAAAPVESRLSAEEFVYDADAEVVRAQGDVRLTQSGQSLQAKTIVYNIRDDVAYAQGGVILTDESGDRHYADLVELNDTMRRGLVQNLYSEFKDGSRLWAKQAVRESEQRHVLKDARYTPCQACEDDPDNTPQWALRASEVTHDKENATIEYRNARFEAWGVPLAYNPYFSHPDGTIVQKSGFLKPEFGLGRDYGFDVMML